MGSVPGVISALLGTTYSGGSITDMLSIALCCGAPFTHICYCGVAMDASSNAPQFELNMEELEVALSLAPARYPARYG